MEPVMARDRRPAQHPRRDGHPLRQEAHRGGARGRCRAARAPRAARGLHQAARGRGGAAGRRRGRPAHAVGDVRGRRDGAFVPLAGLVDLADEAKRLQKQIAGPRRGSGQARPPSSRTPPSWSALRPRWCEKDRPACAELQEKRDKLFANLARMAPQSPAEKAMSDPKNDQLEGAGKVTIQSGGEAKSGTFDLQKELAAISPRSTCPPGLTIRSSTRSSSCARAPRRASRRRTTRISAWPTCRWAWWTTPSASSRPATKRRDKPAKPARRRPRRRRQEEGRGEEGRRQEGREEEGREEGRPEAGEEEGRAKKAKKPAKKAAKTKAAKKKPARGKKRR